jgi:small subunit ribosomal protein S8
MTDQIADMLTRIRNAQRANHLRVKLPSSKFKLAIAKVLKEEGYVDNVVQHKKGFKITMDIALRKINDNYAISKIKRISKPGKRIYTGKHKIPKVLEGCGIAIISTSQGVMTNTEAKKRGLGGEIICEVW